MNHQHTFHMIWLQMGQSVDWSLDSEYLKPLLSSESVHRDHKCPLSHNPRL